MFWSVGLSQKALRCLTVILVALCFTVPFVTLSSDTPGTFHSWLLDSVRSVNFHSPAPAPPSDFFQWEEFPSEFRPLNFDNVAGRSVEELCRAFPAEKLERIQPVLKTGHGVIEDRLSVQFQSTSACLDNLLVFSDLEETFQGRDIHDVIADIPPEWSHTRSGRPHAKDQFESYYRLQELAANDTAQSANIDVHEGWRLDKFKFLAGVNTAWRLRPNRDWYVFLEDDTFVVWDSMFRMLGHFNPETPWYFGSPTPDRQPYKWPQTWYKDNSKMSFAYGGTGYILSRAAMRKLVLQTGTGRRESTWA